jgi:hypothetical protein
LLNIGFVFDDENMQFCHFLLLPESEMPGQHAHNLFRIYAIYPDSNDYQYN